MLLYLYVADVWLSSTAQGNVKLPIGRLTREAAASLSTIIPASRKEGQTCCGQIKG